MYTSGCRFSCDTFWLPWVNTRVRLLDWMHRVQFIRNLQTAFLCGRVILHFIQWWRTLLEFPTILWCQHGGFWLPSQGGSGTHCLRNALVCISLMASITQRFPSACHLSPSGSDCWTPSLILMSFLKISWVWEFFVYFAQQCLMCSL